MDWLTELIKHVSVAKTVAFALFCTSLTLLFGNQLLPGEIPELAREWRIIAWGVLVYSGVILFLAFAELLWGLIGDLFRAVSRFFRGRFLTGEEKFVLGWLGQNGHEEISLYGQIDKLKGGKKLDFLSILETLDNKGYISRSWYDETAVQLTSKGRKKAREILTNEWPKDTDA